MEYWEGIPQDKFFTVASVTYNNLGCYYQKQNKFDKGLRYLKKSIDFNSLIAGDEMNLASTHLNVCALYSKKGEHETAYKHAKTSLKLLPLAYK